MEEKSKVLNTYKKGQGTEIKYFDTDTISCIVLK